MSTYDSTTSRLVDMQVRLAEARGSFNTGAKPAAQTTEAEAEKAVKKVTTPAPKK